jgi:putative ABC transport system permease protein
MTALLHELRRALRTIVREPAHSALVVGVLAAGLTCVFFMVVMINALVIRPLPFPAPDELLGAGVIENHGSGPVDSGVNDDDFLQIRHQLAGVADVASYSSALIRLSDGDRPEIYDGSIVSTNLFHVFAVSPLLGRDFATGDGSVGAPAVAILSYRVWQDRYVGDPSIVGRHIRVNSRAAAVIGVMPSDFGYPGSEALWIPAQLIAGKSTIAADWGINIVMRRAPGVSSAAVKAAAQLWFNEAAHANPNHFRNSHVVVEPLTHYSERDRLFYTLAFAMVILVLLIACANAANLLLIRTLGHRPGLAIRVALGASRRQLVVHLLMQSLLLSAAASAIALPLAVFGASRQEEVFARLTSHPPWQHFTLDWNIVLWVFATTLLTTGAASLMPALHASREAGAAPLRDGSRSVTGGSFARASRWLVTGQIALSCVLLISVGTMVRAIAAIEHADLGINENHLLSAKFDLTLDAYPTPSDQLRLYEKLSNRLRDDGDVVDASIGQIMPGQWSDTREVAPAGAAIAGGNLPHMYYGAVDEHSLRTYGIALREGRFFSVNDTAESTPVAVVDRRFVEEFGNGASVLGRQFRIDPSDTDGATVTVVGVTESLGLVTAQETRYPSMLVPLRQSPNIYGIVAVRTRGEPNAFAPRLREIMRSIDADTPLYHVGDYKKFNRLSSRNERQNARWFGIAGLIALLIAGVGLYGVMAFTVGQRTREIGVRRALGAPAAKILGDLFQRNAWQIAVGVLFGLALGVPFAGLLTRYSGSIHVHDPRIELAVILVVILAAAVAVLVPARRALRVDPIEALRHE